MKNTWKTIKNFLEKSPAESVIIATFLVATFYVLAPFDGLVNAKSPAVDDQAASLVVEQMLNESVPYGELPESKLTGSYSVATVQASAYNSVPGQTDSTPFTTASGTTVRRGVIAANFLPIGTKITIPEVYGDEIFVVEDRMNSRYHNNIDIWMESVSDARAFGRKSVEIHIYSK